MKTLLSLTVLSLALLARAGTPPPIRWCATVSAQASCGHDVFVSQGTNVSWGLGNCQSFGMGSGGSCDDTNKSPGSILTISTPICAASNVLCGTATIVCANGLTTNVSLTMPANRCAADYYIVTTCNASNLCTIGACLLTQSCPCALNKPKRP